MGKYSIKDLEKLTGIKAHTIRIWERRYALITPERTDTNIRTYCDDDLKKLLSISILNKNGLKISRLADLGMDEIQKKLLLISKNNNDSDLNIDNLLMAMLDLDEERFNRILDIHIKKDGFEKTYENIISKLLKKAGNLWLTGCITPAQEHFVSNIIRQKIILALNSIKPVKISRPKKFLLFLPEGEWHELGLLYTAFLIKKTGHKTLYLGQNTPLQAAKNASDHWKSDFVVYAVLSQMNTGPINELQSSINKLFCPLPIISNIPSGTDDNLNSDCSQKCIDDYYKLEKVLNDLSDVESLI